MSNKWTAITDNGGSERIPGVVVPRKTRLDSKVFLDSVNRFKKTIAEKIELVLSNPETVWTERNGLEIYKPRKYTRIHGTTFGTNNIDEDVELIITQFATTLRVYGISMGRVDFDDFDHINDLDEYTAPLRLLVDINTIVDKVKEKLIKRSNDDFMINLDFLLAIGASRPYSSSVEIFSNRNDDPYTVKEYTTEFYERLSNLYPQLFTLTYVNNPSYDEEHTELTDIYEEGLLALRNKDLYNVVFKTIQSCSSTKHSTMHLLCAKITDSLFISSSEKDAISTNDVDGKWVNANKYLHWMERDSLLRNDKTIAPKALENGVIYTTHCTNFNRYGNFGKLNKGDAQYRHAGLSRHTTYIPEASIKDITDLVVSDDDESSSAGIFLMENNLFLKDYSQWGNLDVNYYNKAEALNTRLVLPKSGDIIIHLQDLVGLESVFLSNIKETSVDARILMSLISSNHEYIQHNRSWYITKNKEVILADSVVLKDYTSKEGFVFNKDNNTIHRNGIQLVNENILSSVSEDKLQDVVASFIKAISVISKEAPLEVEARKEFFVDYLDEFEHEFNSFTKKYAFLCLILNRMFLEEFILIRALTNDKLIIKKGE